MIRFCDNEAACIEYSALSDKDSLNRADLLLYFLDDHKDDIVCVYDDFNTMGFIGIITYQSLNSSLTFRGAIQMDYLVLDENIWRNARAYFETKVEFSGSGCLIPVFDKEGGLLCFAYEDADANREIRQLRELSEMPDALQFSDIYPEYKSVTIHEFNELAYFFAKYLESQNIAVQVEGKMWQGFFEGEECCVPNYECLNIYAEGTWKKPKNWKENLLRSVSVEFECIDRIYEANIKSGAVQDAKGDIATLLESLRGKEEIILFGIDREEQNAYDYLKGNGIEVCGFIGRQENVEYSHVLFGKKIMSSLEARTIYKNAVFIGCKAKNSAWGFGGVDFFDYIGFRRNERFILLKDYLDIPENSLLNLLKGPQIVLTGEINLCRRLYDYLKEHKIFVDGYLHTIPEEGDLRTMPGVYADEMKEETLCLIVVPDYFSYESRRREGEEKRKEIKRYLIENNINNYTDYFSNMISFIAIERESGENYTKDWLRPRKIVLGSIEAYNGNVFFRSLLDSHPEIAIMYYGELNDNLFWICMHLAMENASDILSLFWKMIEGNENHFISPSAFIEGNENHFINPSAFNEKMQQLLGCGSKFTSQELFVMFHIAYMYMCGRDITGNDIRDMIIYWEPHHLERNAVEEYVYWLGKGGEVECDIINVVRNICMQNGSRIKESLVRGERGIYPVIWYPNIDKKKYAQGDRLVVKFEDLKCKPKETLMQICDKWGIKWSDTFMETTRMGEKAVYSDGIIKVSGFDLGPVYNTYEQFFSGFDRFRMMLINAPWQRKYGYPYVELLQFSRRDLQEMFLKSFRFEDLEDAELHRDSTNFGIYLQMQIREQLQKTRMIESNCK